MKSHEIPRGSARQEVTHKTAGRGEAPGALKLYWINSPVRKEGEKEEKSLRDRPEPHMVAGVGWMPATRSIESKVRAATS